MVDDKMRAVFDAWWGAFYRRWDSAPGGDLVVEWVIDYLRTQQEPLIPAPKSGGGYDYFDSTGKQVGHDQGDRLYGHPVPPSVPEYDKTEITRLRAELGECHKAYWKMRNAAAGYSNYCEESASVRRCEREYEEAEAVYRAIAAAPKQGEK